MYLEQRIATLEAKVKELQKQLKMPVSEIQSKIPAEQWQWLLQSVCNFYGIEPKAIMGKSQRYEVYWPRWVTMVMACKLLKLAPVVVARKLKKDHSSVYNALKRMDEIIAGEPNSADVKSYKTLLAKLQLELANNDKEKTEV